MTAPERTANQRREALEEANRIRTLRADLKRDVEAGRVDWRDVVAPGWREVAVKPDAIISGDVNPDLATMKVYDLLLAVPKVGRVKAGVIMRSADVSPSKTVGGLSRRQRADLIIAAARRSTTVRHPRDAAERTSWLTTVARETISRA